MKLTFLLLILQTSVLQLANYTYKWQGSDVAGHCYAGFEDFNGRQDFKLKSGVREAFLLEMKTSLLKGKMKVQLKEGSKVLLEKELAGKDTVSIRLSNPDKTKYKVIFLASHAYGSFDYQYRSK
jgi:predicted DNA-binding antitoxin AbrB/MazE fold protein